MFDEDQNKDDRGPKKPTQGGFKFPPMAWGMWIIILGSLVALMVVKNRVMTPNGTLPEPEFLQKFEANQIVNATVNYNPQTAPLTQITGKYYKAAKNDNPHAPRHGREFKAALGWFFLAAIALI